MNTRHLILGLCLALLPLTASAQNGRAGAPARNQTNNASAPAGNPPAQNPSSQPPQNDAVADRATLTLRCQTQSDADLAIGGCTALIQSGALSDVSLAAIYARRAALYAQQNNNDKAIKDIDQSMLLSPGDAGLYALRGQVAQALQQTPDAIESYNRCYQLDPGRSDCQSSLAQLQNNSQKENDACAAGGDPDTVIQGCSVLIERAPKVAKYYNARGAAYFNKKDFRRALDDFSASLRIEPQDTVILTNRCNVYIQTRQYDRALDDCNDALHAKSDNVQALYGRGLARFNRDDADGAIADFNAVLEKNPSNAATVMGYRGAAFLKRGDLSLAERDLNEALRLSPTSAGAHAYLGGLYVEENEPDKAIGELDTALRLNPNLAMALIYRARAYIKKHQTALAMKDLDLAVTLEPDNAFVFQARGLVYVSLGQTNKAAADFKACRVLDVFAPCGGAKPDMPNAVPPSSVKKPTVKASVAKPPATANAKPAPKINPQAKVPATAAKPSAPAQKTQPAQKPQPKK